MDVLEREAQLGTLASLVDRARSGHGSTVLVAGEAGIGKTTLVRAFLGGVPGGVRVLAAACEDLLTPRTLGPLRDAVRGRSGPLADAFAADAEPAEVFASALDELGSGAPTVLAVDDAHWADGATIDVLRFVGRRVAELPVVLLVAYRDDELDARHPLRRFLGAMTGPDTVRVRIPPLSPAAVDQLAAGSGVDFGELHRQTSGNPFFVTEVLAAPDEPIPPTVVDAVLARLARLSQPAQAAVCQLAVVPRGVDLGMLRALVPDLVPIGEAETAGVVTIRDDLLRFRHELARRTVVASLPVSVCADLNAAVLRVLLAGPEPDPFRVLHHAVAAGDDDAVVTYGQRAARQAARAGAHRQAASCFGLVLERASGIPAEEQARLSEGYAWALSHSNEFHAAADAAADAVQQWRSAGSDNRLVRALITLTRQLWLTERTDEARASAEKALALARPGGDSTDHATALLGLGGFLVLVDEEPAGIAHLEEGLAMTRRMGERRIEALTLNYLGSGLLQLGDLAGRDVLLDSVALAQELPDHEFVMRGFYNLAEGLWRLGRYDDALGYLDRTEEYAAEREFPAHEYMVRARRLRHLGMQGRWSEAVDGLREMVDGHDDPGMIGRETLPVLARLLVRQGSPDAQALLAESTQHARRAGVLEWLVPTGLAVIEHAWLHDQPELVGDWPDLLLRRTDRPGLDVQRGELLRYLARLGRPVDPGPGCPPAYAAGIRGDWRAAADAWRRAGDPYEQALELTASGEADPTLEGLAVLDRLGARPAADAARARLRSLGVARVPRRPVRNVVENAFGLTARQVEILGLLAGGLSNAEIAARLVLSPRTVDHHVAAVFQKLDVHSRHDAAAAAARLGLAD